MGKSGFPFVDFPVPCSASKIRGHFVHIMKHSFKFTDFVYAASVCNNKISFHIYHPDIVSICSLIEVNQSALFIDVICNVDDSSSCSCMGLIELFCIRVSSVHRLSLVLVPVVRCINPN